MNEGERKNTLFNSSIITSIIFLKFRGNQAIFGSEFLHDFPPSASGVECGLVTWQATSLPLLSAILSTPSSSRYNGGNGFGLCALGKIGAIDTTSRIAETIKCDDILKCPAYT